MCVIFCYLVNGIFLVCEDFVDVEKCQLIELFFIVFDDICKVIIEDIVDDIGNLLSKEEGYVFLIKCIGFGCDIKYDVLFKCKVYKGDIEDKFWNIQYDLIVYVNQVDEICFLLIVCIMGCLIGIVVLIVVVFVLVIFLIVKILVVVLSGFGFVIGYMEGVIVVVIVYILVFELISLVDEEIFCVVEIEFKLEVSFVVVVVLVKEFEVVVVIFVVVVFVMEDEGLDDLLRELDFL